jgi:hypothetical protein
MCDRENRIEDGGAPQFIPLMAARALTASACQIEIKLRHARTVQVADDANGAIVALIEEAAKRLTDNNMAEAVALAMRSLLEQDARVGSLFGVHRGPARVREGIDLAALVLDVEPDAETGREIDR